MSDLISRSALIEELNKYLINHYSIHKNDLAEAIAKQPSVEPVRGEWIYTPTFNEYECSNCKSIISLSDDANAHPNFCPQCGADMRKKVTE